MKIIRTRIAIHHNQRRILLIFNFDYDLIQQRKEVAGGFESGGSL